MRLFGQICLWLLLCAAAWGGGLIWFFNQIPQEEATDITPADTIVVLTGGAGRLELGLQLLAQGKAPMLFISGVSKGTTVGEIARLASPAAKQGLERFSPAIHLGDAAVNTIGNAEETKRWLGEQHVKNLILVTSNYHMPRSISEFNAALPDVALQAAPVISEEFRPARWWQHETSQRLVLSEYHKFLASKLRHWLIA